MAVWGRWPAKSPVWGQHDSMNRQIHGRSTVPILQLPTSGLYRPIFAYFNAEARRVAQDPTGPFCTMKARTARGFCANLRNSGQIGLLGRFQVGQPERKEEMNAYLPDRERFVQRRTSLEGWPV